MAFSEHALLEFGGSLLSASGASNEVWSCGIRVVSFNSLGAIPESEIEGFLDALASGAHAQTTTLPAWFTASANKMSPWATLKHIKLNNIGSDGKYSNSGITHVRDVTATPAAATIGVPAFLSLAYTWETGKTRGRAHRGRIYPPNPMFSVTGSKISSADATTNATAGKNLIQLINAAHCDDAGSDRLQAMVMSRIDGSKNAITGVSSDDVYDVQRRRKNAAISVRSATLAV